MGVAYGEPYAFPNGMVLTIAKPHMVDGQVQLPITVVNTGDTKLDGSMFGIGFEAIGASGDIDSAFCNGDEPYRTDTILPGRTVKWIECFDAKSAAGVAVEAITNTGTEDQAEVTVGG